MTRRTTTSGYCTEAWKSPSFHETSLLPHSDDDWNGRWHSRRRRRVTLTVWFGAAHVHPMLPSTAMLVYATAQTISYIWSAAHGEYVAADLTSVVYIVTFGAPVCLAFLGLVQLHLLRRAGVRLSEATTQQK
jgi:hypothetical protein